MFNVLTFGQERVSTMSNEVSHNFRSAVMSGILERRVSRPGLPVVALGGCLGVHVGAAGLHQHFDQVSQAVIDRLVQGRLSIIVNLLIICGLTRSICQWSFELPILYYVGVMSFGKGRNILSIFYSALTHLELQQCNLILVGRTLMDFSWAPMSAPMSPLTYQMETGLPVFYTPC